MEKKISEIESKETIVLTDDPHHNGTTFNFRYRISVFDNSTGSPKSKTYISINGGTGATTGLGPGRLMTYNQINEVPVSINCPSSGPLDIQIRVYTLTGGFDISHPSDVVNDETYTETLQNCQAPTTTPDPNNNFYKLVPGSNIWYRSGTQTVIELSGSAGGGFQQVVTWPPTH